MNKGTQKKSILINLTLIEFVNSNEILNEYFQFSRQPKNQPKKKKGQEEVTTSPSKRRNDNSNDIYNQIKMSNNDINKNNNNPKNIALLKSLKEEIDQLENEKNVKHNFQIISINIGIRTRNTIFKEKFKNAQKRRLQ